MPSLLLTGDVMIGRGIDQVLRHPSSPELYEPFVRSASIYVELAEAKSGRIPRLAGDDYVWGDALQAMRSADVAIVNLETAVTRADQPAPNKGIHYRCHPANAPCLSAAGIDCCVLANNHVLDWGLQGLAETLETLRSAGLPIAGAGHDLAQADAPAVLEHVGTGRVLVYAFGHPSSGIPADWSAGAGRPGVNYLGDLSEQASRDLVPRLARDKSPGDIVILSIHWGPNWGYDIAEAQRSFAQLMIDEAGVDIVHGHSSHHPMAIELRRGRPIFYGCGDFLNDYEGIGGHEEYRPDLVLAYRVTPGEEGAFEVEMLPYRIERFRLTDAEREEAQWLRARMDRECRRFGGRVTLEGERRFRLRLSPA